MSATPRVYVTDLTAAERVEGAFAMANCQLGRTRNGKLFIKCLLGDKSGSTPGRLWNATQELFDGLPTDGFVHLEGETQPYQGEMQIIIHSIRTHDPSDGELMELLPSTERDVDVMFAELLRLLQSLEHPAIRAVAEAYLEDADLMGRFCQAPAAKQLHHACLGGLLEHTLSLLRLAERVLPEYPELNRDIVLLGLFLHDLGKCAELTWQRGLGYSTDGHLVGHVARGVIWLEDKVRVLREAGTEVPEPILRVLEHIILSHHGQPEFGAAKIPATPEAWAVSLIDNLDAKLHMAMSPTRGQTLNKPRNLGGDFTEKIWALNTRLYRPDPTTVNGE